MLDVAWGGMLLSQHQRLYQQHQRLFLCQEVLQLHILQPSPSPFHSASFSCSVVSTTFVQNVVSFLGAPLIAHLSGKEAEAMPLNWVFEEFCWHWISKRRSIMDTHIFRKRSSLPHPTMDVYQLDQMNADLHLGCGAFNPVEHSR